MRISDWSSDVCSSDLIDEHAANEVYELWKSLFGVVCRLAAAEMTDRDGRELMHRLVEYKDVTQRTDNTFEHIKVSNRIGRFIAKRSNEDRKSVGQGQRR